MCEEWEVQHCAYTYVHPYIHVYDLYRNEGGVDERSLISENDSDQVLASSQQKWKKALKKKRIHVTC